VPEGDLSTRGMMSLQLASWQWEEGHIKEAAPLLTAAYEAGQKAANQYVAATSLAMLATAAQVAGELRRPFEQQQQIIELTGPTPRPLCRTRSWAASPTNGTTSGRQFVTRSGRSKLWPAYGRRHVRWHGNTTPWRRPGSPAAMPLEPWRTFELSCRMAHGASQPGFRAEHAAFHVLWPSGRTIWRAVSEWGGRLARGSRRPPFLPQPCPASFLIAQGEKGQGGGAAPGHARSRPPKASRNTWQSLCACTRRWRPGTTEFSPALHDRCLCHHRTGRPPSARLLMRAGCWPPAAAGGRTRHLTRLCRQAAWHHGVRRAAEAGGQERPRSAP